VKRTTLNKDIRNLKAFVSWGRENRYVNGEIKIKLLKEDERPVKSLTNTQIKRLLLASKRYHTLRMRILLALGTGLRRGDIESLSVPDIDFESSYVTTRSKKTRKSMFHDLRKTFGSVLAQNGVSTAVTQRLLEHSSADLTNKVYTNVDPVLHHAVDLIPAGDWL